MNGRHIVNIEEIRAYMKVRTKLGHLEQIFTEFCGVYMSHKVSFETARRIIKKFQISEYVKEAGK